MLLGTQIHLRRSILLDVALDQAPRNLGQKARTHGPLLRASTKAAAGSRPAQEQPFLGARHAYVTEPAFFLQHGW